MGHSLGRMHSKDSGFSDGLWTHQPTRWNLDRNPGFFTGQTLPASAFYTQQAPNGSVEFVNPHGFQNLPGADMPLIWDTDLNAIVHEYNRGDRKAFRRDAAAAWKKLTELGCNGILTPEANFTEDVTAGWNTGTRW
jgi:cytochrome c peroxidase